MKQISKNKEQKIINFIKELSWFLDAHKDVSIKDVQDLLEQKSSTAPVCESSVLQADTRYLVGVLPQIFQDTDLFPKNEDIISFASDILDVSLNIGARRSRIEYIGTILCQVSNANIHNRDVLVKALENLIGSDNKKREIIARKKTEPSFSWSEAILKLADL